MNKVILHEKFALIHDHWHQRLVADEEVQVMLFELKSTLRTGNVTDERTAEKLEWI